MSEETFELGEVAIHHNPGSRNHGREVTILSRLENIRLRRADGSLYSAPGYCVELDDGSRRSPAGRPWGLPHKQLRKKKPPREDTGRWEDIPFYIPPSRRTVPA